MPGPCSHQFVWPRRASDGRYYQVCRHCQAEYEYDWESMARLPSEGPAGADTASPEISFAKSSGCTTTLKPEVTTRNLRVREVPPLKLLLEAEPARSIFVENLADLLRPRSPRLITAPSTPGSFLSDVFVPSGLPWWWLAESLLGHMIVVAAVLILFQKWPVSEPIEQPNAFHKSYISYYTPPKSFPALGSHSPRVRAQTNRPSEPPRRPAIRVVPERTQTEGQKASTLRPPDLMAAGSKRLGAKGFGIATAPPPMMPLSATGRSHLTVPVGPTWMVAPPADPSQASARRSGLLQASAVAPSPEVGGVSSRRSGGAGTSPATVIAPPPSVPGSMRQASDINIGESAVVQPAPQLPMDAQGDVSGMAQGGLGNLDSVVVPPPPSVQSGGSFSDGRGNSLAAFGPQVVPPAPSMQGAGNAAASGRGSSLSTGLQVVAPAPSLRGAGHAGGNARANSLSGLGPQVVPPAPSTQGTGRAGSGSGDSLSAGLQAVPPPPSLQGEGKGGSGRGNSLSGRAAGLPPASSAQGEGSEAGGSTAAEGSETGNVSENTSASSEATADPHEPPTLEIPLRLIAPVLALPGSSYFSNYEVFIAERELGNNKSQFIKLVYVSLPYQRRLSEYAPNKSAVYKLRVTRDQTCDESLLQMTWPETDPRPDSQHAADSPALTSQERSGMLPCYRTTADDYRRAISRKR